MRKVFLDELPRLNGYEGKRIDWSNSVGKNVKFIYDDIEGEIEIISYNKKGEILIIMYKDNRHNIKSVNFKQCKIGGLLGARTKEFKFEIGQVLKDEKRDLTITDRKYRQRNNISKGIQYTINDKYYKYTCNKCGWAEGWIIEGSIAKGIGCGCCENQVAVLGINTIWDTDRWMVDLGISEEDAKKYTRGSSKKIEVSCPDCGERKFVRIIDIYNRKTISCTCGDGFSYSEKFMANMLKQLNINHKTQLNKTDFDWCGKYKYDFYIPSLNMIIETHGEQHYRECPNFKVTLAEVQENDRVKENLAWTNNIDKYIIIDCRRSELDWVKNSILNSELSDIFDLSKIDWLKCEELALKSIEKEVWDYWNNRGEIETVSDLMKIFKLSRQSILRYLKNGHKLNICVYDVEKEREIVGIKNKISKGKKVEVFKDDVFLGKFISCTDLSSKSEELFGVKLIRQAISSFCSGKYNGKTYKGFTFKYVEDVA